MARKRGSKPTSKARSRKQEIKDRYAHAREDAQLAGLIPTTPEEALKDERVDPATQGTQALPGLIGQAVTEGWATPDPMKRVHVQELFDIATNPDIDPRTRVLAIRTAQTADRDQWDRDNPDKAGKARGGSQGQSVNVTVVTGQAVLQSILDAPQEPDKIAKELAEIEASDPPPTGPDAA